MERKIKFRGWVTKKKRWAYGSLVTWPDNSKSIFEKRESNKALYQVTVNTNSVGQFTGFHDKNKTDIYEGDILKDMWSRYVVEFDRDCGEWVGVEIDGNVDGGILFVRLAYGATVIDNKFEKELRECGNDMFAEGKGANNE